MSSTRTCPQCGTTLPAGAPAWLCSKCLLAQAVEGPEAEEPRWGEAVPSHSPEAQGAGGPAAAESGPAATPVFDESSCGPLGRTLPCRLGDYELVERIGQGGMGVVYRARQVSLDRDVAVKVLSPSALGSPEAVHRFQTEAVTAGSLQHPNIVAVHEVGHAEGLHYLVMDYVAGPTLGDLVRNGPLPARQAALYLRTIAEAVHFAHEHGVLHRDLKPSNVLLDANDQPRVTDFGLAKRFVAADVSPRQSSRQVTEGSAPTDLGGYRGPSELTLSGQVLGSPAFIPPEQASGDRGRVGRRSDVYALGAILYQLLTGRPPFVGEALADMLRQVLNEDPLSPRLLNPAVPRDLETICLKCLEKEPDRRYPTAMALAEELGRWLEGRPILARHLGPVAKTWRWCRRNPRLAGLAAGLALAVVGGFVGVLTQLQRARAAELIARQHAYATDMNLVQQALDRCDLSTAQELLERHRPAGETEGRGQRSEVSATKSQIRNQKSEIDLRGWEWRYLWARSRSEERFTLHEYPGAVAALAFSPDGRWLAVRWEEEGLELWDAVTTQSVARLPARNAMGWHWRSKALAFSSQGNLLAWGNAAGEDLPVVSVRDLAAQREIQSLPHTHELVSVAFSPDASLLAGLADNGVLRVWDMESGQVVTNFTTAPARDPTEGPAASVEADATATAAETAAAAEPGALPRRPVMRSVQQTEHYGCVQFSPDGRWLAVGEAQPRVRIWDWTTRQEVEPLIMPADADGITAVAFSPDSTRLAASGGGRSGDVHVWDLATRAEQRFTGHRARVIGLAFSPDGQRLATGSADQTLRLWDVATGNQQRLLQGNTAEIWAITWSPNDRDLVTGARDGTVRYWDPNSKATPACAVLPSKVWSFGIAFTPDSRTFLTVNNTTSTIEKWDLATLRSESLPFPGAGHRSLDLSPDGRRLALADTNGHVQIWDFYAERLVADRAVPEASMLVGVRFSPRGRYVGSAALVAEGSLPFKIWEAPAWREVSLQHLGLTNLFGLDFTPDERTLAIGYYDGAAAWKDLATGTTREFFPTRHGGSMHVKFSADGRWFVTGGVMNGLMTLCDVASDRRRYIGPDSPYVLHTLVFSPDGRRLVTSGASLGDLFRFWDVTTGRHLLSLPAPIEGFYTRLGFSPDGNTLFAASLEGTTLLWRAPSWEVIEAAASWRDASR